LLQTLPETQERTQREVDMHIALGGSLIRACRVTTLGGLGQRFQPKEHSVLVLG